MDNRPLEYQIDKGWVKAIFIYYSLIILSCSTFIVILILTKIGNDCSQEEIKSYTFFMAILSSAMLAAVRYSQKLYKACIDNRVSIANNDKAVNIGNILYFILRPIFAMVFSILFVICLFGGLLFLLNGIDFAFNERIVYLTAIVSACIGFSIGGVLDSFEIISKGKLNKMV